MLLPFGPSVPFIRVLYAQGGSATIVRYLEEPNKAVEPMPTASTVSVESESLGAVVMAHFWRWASWLQASVVGAVSDVCVGLPLHKFSRPLGPARCKPTLPRAETQSQILMSHARSAVRAGGALGAGFHGSHVRMARMISCATCGTIALPSPRRRCARLGIPLATRPSSGSGFQT